MSTHRPPLAALPSSHARSSAVRPPPFVSHARPGLITAPVHPALFPPLSSLSGHSLLLAGRVHHALPNREVSKATGVHARMPVRRRPLFPAPRPCRDLIRARPSRALPVL